jgi:creatinine amidohydrolase
LSELIRNGFNRIIVLSGHAGNSHMVALRLAAQDIVQKNEGKARIMVLSDFYFAEDLTREYAKAGDGHAGTLETSRVMAIKPELIKTEGKNDTWKLPRFEVVAHPEDFIGSGVNGDASAASAEIGQKANSYIIQKVAELVEEIKK